MGQNKCFRLCYLSSVLSDDVEILPWSKNEIKFDFNSQGLKIEVPDIGTFKMSRNLIYKEESFDDGLTAYFLFDLDSDDGNNYTAGIAYGKSDSCNLDNWKKNLFSILFNGKWYTFREGVSLYFDCNNNSDSADQNLWISTIQEDLLIKFFKSFQ